ncbi:MAG: hypothetical protein AB1706_19635, partial [Pseudomonadota bacterium]
MGWANGRKTVAIVTIVLIISALAVGGYIYVSRSGVGATDYVKGELIVKFKQGVVVGENVWESIARTPSLYNLHVKWG